MHVRRATIADVAARAGVSTGTVSNVLSGARHVSPHTRARVEAALTELDFRPNRIARALTQRRTQTVAMVIPDIANPFFAELVRDVEQRLLPAGYAVVVGNAGNDPDVERRYLTDFADRRVDAIVAATAGVDVDFLHGLAESVPTLLLDRHVSGWKGDLVVVDNRAGMTQAIDHLIELGHSEIAFIDGEPTLSSGRERLDGFRSALLRHGFEPAAVATGPFTLEAGRELARSLLADNPALTALCAVNDLQAFGALLAARELRRRVPRDLSVTGYDDIPYAALAAPPLTTVRQPIGDLAAAIVAALIRRLRHPGHPPNNIVLAAELVVRKSTAAAPA